MREGAQIRQGGLYAYCEDGFLLGHMVGLPFEWICGLSIAMLRFHNVNWAALPTFRADFPAMGAGAAAVAPAARLS